ncbi:MAG: internal scaffolding protein [Microvirus sp.]|nr:MAG: internal scaffolding protein [Microvirus sp.]WNK14410.1 MAG: internal scaffolding protein [Microvirus sp.]
MSNLNNLQDSHIVYTRFNPAPQVGLKCEDQSLTQSHFLAECDINQILAKFRETGIIDEIGPGAYLDLSESVDYQQAMHTIMAADNAFGSLPAVVRKEFNNNPGNYMEFLHNPDNYQKAVELGLALPQAPIKEPLTTQTEP